MGVLDRRRLQPSEDFVCWQKLNQTGVDLPAAPVSLFEPRGFNVRIGRTARLVFGLDDHLRVDDRLRIRALDSGQGDPAAGFLRYASSRRSSSCSWDLVSSSAAGISAMPKDFMVRIHVGRP
mgnify:CR=1 FL=1